MKSKTQWIIALLLAVTLLGSIGCSGPLSRRERGGLIGAGLGAGTGAIIGSTGGHAAVGALIGGTIGVVAGGVIVGRTMGQGSGRDDRQQQIGTNRGEGER